MSNKLIKDTTDSAQKDIIDGYKTKELYEIISSSLDMLGYSQEMVQYRRDMNTKLDDIYNCKPFAVSSITTGGKADGSALYFESDIDRLYVVKGKTCVLPGVSCESSTLLCIERQGCSPGYTRLKLLSQQENDRILIKYLVQEDNETYVSNRYSFFPENTHMIDINEMTIYKQTKSGPSAPYGNTSIKYDFVFGFECKCPDLIEKWAKRTRKYNWPDKNLVLHVSSLEGHVVPVANKGSKYPNTEWRICFNKAEMMLFRSMDEFQFKTYIVLKVIAKSVLKPLCTEMSSYIMKNIVFWVAEALPKEVFTKQSLLDRVFDSFIFLEECIRLNSLKSYMIPERNLFEERISIDERDSLLNKINELLHDKEGLFKQCKKLFVAMTKVKESPTKFLEEAEKRDKIEKHVYKKNVIFKETDCPGQGLEIVQDRLKQKKFIHSLKKNLMS